MGSIVDLVSEKSLQKSNKNSFLPYYFSNAFMIITLERCTTPDYFDSKGNVYYVKCRRSKLNKKICAYQKTRPQ